MTREEAVQKLITHKLWHQDEFIDFTGTVEAIDMAIEALKEQRPKFYISNTVDQEKLKDMIKNYPPMFVTPGTEKVEIIPEQQWIPCSERLPEYANYYLTSTEYDGVYCDFWDGYNFNRTEKIIAWMPLPEPYKENES
ncbi:MAG: DUF551 domain-containing protein [Oscillospiraceae bacterium]|nr:DUF551 domain-containing protein [Oscillospiraceae bacterium]